MSERERTEAAAATSGSGGRGRWKTWALVLSLGLNLFVAASVIGAGLRHHRMGPHGDVRDVGFGPFTEALSREDRAALRDAFVAAAPDFRERRREAAEDFGRLAAALRADPWDPVGVEAALARQGQRAAERFDLGRQLFLDRLSAMNPAARAALADRIDSALSRRFRN